MNERADFLILMSVAAAAGFVDDLRAGGLPWSGKTRDDLLRVLDDRARQLERSAG